MTSKALEDLVRLLDLEQLEVNIFRGESRDLGGKSVFGGQVIGQALVAAARTVEDAAPHSLHAYFLRPGDMSQPIVYDVDRVRDGRSFTARRIQAIQNGQPILSMIASFQKPEDGLSHQIEMPDVPPPESLETQHSLRQRWVDAHPDMPERLKKAALRRLALEFRPVHDVDPMAPEVTAPRQQIWLRADGTLPDDPLLHHCILAYASDFNLLSTALRPHGVNYLTPGMISASIDHAVWLHRPVRADEWLLYDMDAPTAQGSRGFSRGHIFSRDGTLVASVAQESLMRYVPERRSRTPTA